jgi:hypothetical protein
MRGLTFEGFDHQAIQLGQLGADQKPTEDIQILDQKFITSPENRCASVNATGLRESLIEGNVFTGGAYGLLISYGIPSYGYIVRDNTFSGQKLKSLFAGYNFKPRSPVIDQVLIEHNRFTASPIAMDTFLSDAVIRNNLSGTWYMTQTVATRAMIPRRRGAIVNIIANIYRGFPGMVHTGAARAGVDNLTKTLAVEWAPHGIRVNAVAPGIIESSGLKQYPPPLIAQCRSAIPFKRMGQVDEVAAPIVFLASETMKTVCHECVKNKKREVTPFTTTPTNNSAIPLATAPSRRRKRPPSRQRNAATSARRIRRKTAVPGTKP